MEELSLFQRIGNALQPLASFVFGDYGSTHFVIAWAILKILIIFFAFGMAMASILTWMERRQSSMMQDRLGPNRANIPLPFSLPWIGRNLRAFGITHFLADALKFMFKEDFVPPKAHKFLFAVAPIMAMAPALVVMAILPFGPELCWGHFTDAVAVCEEPVRLQIAQLDAGLLFAFAISSLSVYGATLAGWSSHNKWSMMGGLRASSQMMSYEVTMGMAVLVMFLIYGTLEPGGMVAKQVGGLFTWGIFAYLPVPVAAVSFILFLTAAIAETKRTPFDIPEGEPEIIGYFVEYSGLRFGMFFLGEFLEIVFSSAIIVTIFFGGWHLPLPAVEAWLASHLPNLAFAFALASLWVAKVFVFAMFQLLIRWSLPRFRSDQLMQLGWQRLLPAAIANVVVTAGWSLYQMGVK